MPNLKKRVIDMTQDNVDAIVPTKRHDLIHYDRSRPYWGVRKSIGNPVPVYVVKIRKQHIEAARRRGRKLTNTIVLGSMPLEDARILAAKTWEEVNDYRISDAIPDYKAGTTPESILDDRPQVENPNYDRLMSILMDAFEQASAGKGAERHGFGLNFEDQDMIEVTNRVGLGFPLGQAIKKLSEGKRLDRAKAKREFLGAIVYIAGAILWMDQQE